MTENIKKRKVSFSDIFKTLTVDEAHSENQKLLTIAKPLLLDLINNIDNLDTLNTICSLFSESQINQLTKKIKLQKSIQYIVKEIGALICSFLNIKDKLNFNLTCQSFNTATNTSLAWKKK